MRTTLTIDDDVAARLRQLRESGGGSFKELVNDVLRRGLDAGEPRTATTRRRSYTQPQDLGRQLVAVDDVSEALAVAERAPQR